MVAGHHSRGLTARRRQSCGVGRKGQSIEDVGRNATAVLRTLAAAYAEAGKYGDAITTAQRALTLAMAQKNESLTGVLPKEITEYQANRAIRVAKQ